MDTITSPRLFYRPRVPQKLTLRQGQSNVCRVLPEGARQARHRETRPATGIPPNDVPSEALQETLSVQARSNLMRRSSPLGEKSPG